MSVPDSNNDVENVLALVILYDIRMSEYHQRSGSRTWNENFNDVAIRHRPSGGEDDGSRGCIPSEKATCGERLCVRIGGDHDGRGPILTKGQGSRGICQH